MSLVQYRRRVERGEPVGPQPAPPLTAVERALAEERAGNDIARAMLRARFERLEELEAEVAQLKLERDTLKQAVDDLTTPVPKRPRREG